MPFERHGVVFKVLVISVLHNTGKASNRAALAVAAGSEVTRHRPWPGHSPAGAGSSMPGLPAASVTRRSLF